MSWIYETEETCPACGETVTCCSEYQEKDAMGNEYTIMHFACSCGCSWTTAKYDLTK